MRRLILVLALLAALSPAAEIRAAGGSDWFAIDAEARADWTVSAPDPADDRRVLMRMKTAPDGPARTVLVIYPRKSSAYDIAMSTLLKDFAGRSENLEFLAVNFGQDPARGAALLEEARRDAYALIYAMGSETVEWINGMREALPAPVVTVCAKDPVLLGQTPNYTDGSGALIAFTSLNPRIDVQVEYLRELMPRLTNLAILVDAGNISAVETQARPMIEAMRAAGVDAFEAAVTDAGRARAELSALIPDAVARMRRSDPDLKNSAFWITGSTSVFTEIRAINAHAAGAAVLSAAPDVVRSGPDSALLSIGVGFESNAQLAAVYGADILAGRAEAGALPVGVVSPPDIAVNFLRARAIGLKTPFSFFEAAAYIYGPEGAPVRVRGRSAAPPPRLD